MKKVATTTLSSVMLVMFMQGAVYSADNWKLDGDTNDFPAAGAVTITPVQPASSNGKIKQLLLRRDGEFLQGAVVMDTSYSPYKPEERWELRLSVRDINGHRIDVSFSVNPDKADDLAVKASIWKGDIGKRFEDLNSEEFSADCQKPGCEFEIPIKGLDPRELQVSFWKRSPKLEGRTQINAYLSNWAPALLKPGAAKWTFDGLPYDFPMAGSSVSTQVEGEGLAGKIEKMALKVQDGQLQGAIFYDMKVRRSPEFNRSYFVVQDSQGNAVRYSFDDAIPDSGRRQVAPSKSWQEYSTDGAKNLCSSHGCEFSVSLQDLKPGKITVSYRRSGNLYLDSGYRKNNIENTEVKGEVNY